MRRLLRNKRIIISRLKRRIFAAWQPVDVSSPDLVQIVTDAMASGGQIQIEYQGSGWRLIQPYGWNTSKQGNVLLMCYKDTGEIRSYRLDRVLQVLVDESLLMNQEQEVNPNDPTQMYEVRDYNANPEDFEIPPLPNMDEILEISEKEQGQELPFDEGLQYLQNDDVPIPDEEPEIVEEPKQPEEQKEEKPKEEKPKEEPKKEEDIVDKLEK